MAQNSSTPAYFGELKMHGDACYTILDDSGAPLCDNPGVACYASGSPSPQPPPVDYCSTGSSDDDAFTLSFDGNLFPNPPDVQIDLHVMDAASTSNPDPGTWLGIFDGTRVIDFIVVHVRPGSSPTGPIAATYIYSEPRDYLPAGVTTELHPYANPDGAPDIDFFTHPDGTVEAGKLGFFDGNDPSNPPYESVLGERYVQRYHTGITQSGATVARLTPGAVPTAQNLVLEMSPLQDATVQASWDTDWAEYGATFQFPEARQLVVEGGLAADGATLTAASATAGWHGIRADGLNAALTLHDATVEGVRYDPCSGGLCGVPLYPPHASVEALAAAQVHLTGTTVVADGVFANGVLANGARETRPGNDPYTGPPSQVIIRDNAVVQTHDGYGALALAGGRVSSTDEDARIELNTYGGAYSTGWGSRVDVWGNSNVLENLGYGVTARGNGEATVSTPNNLSNTSNSLVESNEGGLRATGGGSIWTGLADNLGACGTGRPAAINFNNLSGDDDARATSGSVVTAECTFWNGRTQAIQLDTFADGSSTVSVEPLQSSLDGSTSGARTAGSGTTRPRGVRTGGLGTELDYGAAGPLGAAAASRRLAFTGDRDGAGVLLAASLILATTDDERLALYSAAVKLAAGGLPDALYTALSADGGLWARRALAVDAAHRSDLTGAAAHAAALASADGHSEFGHSALVRLAADAGDGAAALQALQAFVAAAPALDETGAEALGEAVALVAVTFPELDLGAAAAPPSPALGIAAESHLAVRAALSAYPNPSASGATVALVMPSEGTATVTVHDALGRRVAVLHEGPLSEGAHALELSGTALAPGLYVVTTRVTDASGETQTEAVRWTRTR